MHYYITFAIISAWNTDLDSQSNTCLLINQYYIDCVFCLPSNYKSFSLKVCIAKWPFTRVARSHTWNTWWQACVTHYTLCKRWEHRWCILCIYVHDRPVCNLPWSMDDLISMHDHIEYHGTICRLISAYFINIPCMERRVACCQIFVYLICHLCSWYQTPSHIYYLIWKMHISSRYVESLSKSLILFIADIIGTCTYPWAHEKYIWLDTIIGTNRVWFNGIY